MVTEAASGPDVASVIGVVTGVLALALSIFLLIVRFGGARARKAAALGDHLRPWLIQARELFVGGPLAPASFTQQWNPIMRRLEELVGNIPDEELKKLVDTLVNTGRNLTTTPFSQVDYDTCEAAAKEAVARLYKLEMEAKGAIG